MFASKDAFFSGTVASVYAVNNSVRFRSSATAYLNRTFATPTSSTIYTLSLWVKRGTLSTTQNLFGASTTTSLSFNSSDQIVLTLAGTTAVTTTAVYRDPSSWYHIVYTQNGSAQTIYVNGTSVGTGTTANTVFNTAIAHQLAAANTTNYFDGYMAEVNFVDGQTLTPSSFGVTGPNSVWQPSLYSGSYGTNGFYLKFASFGTAAALGTDSSSNGNTWTVNNVSITAGPTYDAMLDTPTLTSATVANYPTLNPLGGSTPSVAAVLSNANLTAVFNRATNNSWAPATMTIPSSGKWYWEWIQTTGTTTGNPWAFNGVLNVASNRGTQDPSEWRMYIGTNGNKSSNAGGVAYGSAGALNDIFGVAVDMDNGKIFFSKNGTWQGSGDPVAGTNAAYTDLVSSGITWVPGFYFAGDSTGTVSINFGQRSLSYTPPTGYVRLNTYNISAGTVTTSGSFTGNALADGPFVWLNGTPTAMTINGNGVTFGTQADKLANGFKVRTTSTSYNSTGSNTYSVSTTGAQFKYQIAQGNP
jgi:hypothetical protein